MVCQVPDDWVGGDRRRGGVNRMQAFARNCRNQSLGCQGRSTSGENREGRVPKQSTGADRSVIVMKARNRAGAKGSGQVVVRSKQLATGGRRCVRQTSRSVSIRSACIKLTKRSNPMRARQEWMGKRTIRSEATSGTISTSSGIE